MRRSIPLIISATLAVSVSLPALGDSPLRAKGIQSTPEYTDEEIRELERLEDLVKRFADQVEEYRRGAREMLEAKYAGRKKAKFDYYESRIEALEDDQRVRRGDAISKFESFINKYPDDDRYAPDALFRLSELYYERSYEQYLTANQEYDNLLEQWTPDSGAPEPTPPDFHYQPTIAAMQRLVTEFPNYRLVDGAYYLLGYCLTEQGEDDRAVKVFERLAQRKPNSQFIAEVWTRIGEYYFATSDLPRARDAYAQVLNHSETQYYDKALYKLAWTYYRMADPETTPELYNEAVETFATLLDYNLKTKLAGEEKGGDLVKESKQYIAITFAEEKWGSFDKLQTFLEARGTPAYTGDVLIAFGNVLFDQTRYQDSVAVLKTYLNQEPMDPTAPELQEKIVTALERDRSFDQAAQEREILNENYKEGSAWYTHNKDNPEAVKLAENLTKKALYTAAYFYHEQAQKYEESEEYELAFSSYGKAANIYQDYLERFPHDKQVYELTYNYAESLYYSQRFDEAIPQYEWVRDAKHNTTLQKDAANGVVLAWENAIKMAANAGTLVLRDAVLAADRGEEPLDAIEIPLQYQEYIKAIAYFLELVPDDVNRSSFDYLAADVYYRYQHWGEAETRYKNVVASYPAEDVGKYSANVLLDIYLTHKRYQDVADAVKSYSENELLNKHEGFIDSLVPIRSGALFKVAEKTMADEKFDEAAERYIALVDENPKFEFADSALNNAAVCFEKDKRYDSASKMYQRIFDNYPASALADTALFRVAVNAERFFDFNKAIETYRRLVKEYPKSPNRADALYNVAFALENTQQYETAAREYLRYCDLFPDREDAPEVCFNAGLVYEKMGDERRMMKAMGDFIKKYSKNELHRDRVLDAHMRRAKVYEKSKKRKTRNQATKLYELIVEEYTKAPGAKSAPYAAEADFKLIQPKFDSYRKIQFVGSSKKQQEALKSKFETLKEVEKEYARMLGYKQADWSLASLYRIGMLYYEAVKTMLNSECPPDVRRQAASLGLLEEEICDEYKVALEEKAYNIEDKAVQAFEFVINKAREFQIVNEWTQQTLERLNELRKSEWPLQKSAKSFVSTTAFIRPSLLTASGEVLKAPEPVEEPQPEPEDEPVEGDGADGATNSDGSPESSEAAPDNGATPSSPDGAAGTDGDTSESQEGTTSDSDAAKAAGAKPEEPSVDSADSAAPPEATEDTSPSPEDAQDGESSP